MAYFEKTLETLKQVADAAQRVGQAGASASAPGAGASAAPLDPMAVVQALAEGMKNDCAATQQVAIRVLNLGKQYPNKAA